MKDEELKKLIGKYYSATSTDEEEGILRSYFSGDEILPGYEAEKALFSYYMESADVPEPSSDFEDRILGNVYSSTGTGKAIWGRKILLPFLSAAAGILLLAGSYFVFLNRDVSADTFDNPEVAYAETMKVLMDVSSRFNHAAQAIQPVARINEVRVRSLEPVRRSSYTVEKNLKSLGYLSSQEEQTSHVDKDK